MPLIYQCKIGVVMQPLLHRRKNCINPRQLIFWKILKFIQSPSQKFWGSTESNQPCKYEQSKMFTIILALTCCQLLCHESPQKRWQFLWSRMWSAIWLFLSSPRHQDEYLDLPSYQMKILIIWTIEVYTILAKKVRRGNIHAIFTNTDHLLSKTQRIVIFLNYSSHQKNTAAQVK